jgi:cyclic-di-GMP-binding protein
MPSFDVVSKVDWSEVSNALDQALREIAQRFDFKGTNASIERAESVLTVRANAEDRAKAALEVLEQKLVRRKVSLKHLDKDKPAAGPGGSTKIVIRVKEGIESEKAREIVKLVKDSKLKVQAAIQEQAVRITGKKRDDLQKVIAELKQKADDLELDLQYVNFRD